MNTIHKSIKYVSDEDIFIPFEGRVNSCLKPGDIFERGQKLFESEGRKLLSSYSLPEDLGIRPEKTLDCVTRIEGEYISKGDMIAEKIVSAGMMSKRIISDHDGIVNLSKSDLGYVNILSELVTKSCIASFGGVVKDVDFSRGVLVKSDACEIKLFFSKNNSEENVFGELQILSDAESIPSARKMQKSFEGKVVFAGRFLYPELAKELFKRGCKSILTSSMNYDDLKDLDAPVGILTGFGNIYFDSNRFDFLKEFEGLQVCVDNDVVKFPVGLNDKISKMFEQKYYTPVVNKGDIVRSRDLESFGLVGEVTSVEENMAEVLIQDGSKFTINVENLELYSEDFSIMRTRIS